MSQWSLALKDALKGALVDLPAASDGTEIQHITGSGEDAFDHYPTIRVVPAGITRNYNSDSQYIDYEVDFVISTYFDIGSGIVPSEAVINTLLEFNDIILDRLDGTDWLPESTKSSKYSLMENAVSGVIDTTPSKTGTAVFSDIRYPIRYRTVL